MHKCRCFGGKKIQKAPLCFAAQQGFLRERLKFLLHVESVVVAFLYDRRLGNMGLF